MIRSRAGRLTLADLILLIASIGLLFSWVFPLSRQSAAVLPAFVASASFVALVSLGRYRLTQVAILIVASASTAVLPLAMIDYRVPKYLLTLAVLAGLWNIDLRRHRRWRMEGEA